MGKLPLFLGRWKLLVGILLAEVVVAGVVVLLLFGPFFENVRPGEAKPIPEVTLVPGLTRVAEKRRTPENQTQVPEPTGTEFLSATPTETQVLDHSSTPTTSTTTATSEPSATLTPEESTTPVPPTATSVPPSATNTAVPPTSTATPSETPMSTATLTPTVTPSITPTLAPTLDPCSVVSFTVIQIWPGNSNFYMYNSQMNLIDITAITYSWTSPGSLTQIEFNPQVLVDFAPAEPSPLSVTSADFNQRAPLGFGTRALFFFFSGSTATTSHTLEVELNGICTITHNQ